MAENRAENGEGTSSQPQGESRTRRVGPVLGEPVQSVYELEADLRTREVLAWEKFADCAEKAVEELRRFRYAIEDLPAKLKER